jgi:UDP-glucose 4-epimerase
MKMEHQLGFSIRGPSSSDDLIMQLGFDVASGDTGLFLYLFFSFSENIFVTSEVDVSRSDVVQALVIAVSVVVINEGSGLLLQIAFNLVEAMAAAGCKHMVFSSTSATYGDQDGVVLDEQSAQMPLNAYGASKRAVEEILRDFGVSHGLEAVVFRYFNVAGADVEAEVGEWHQPETHLIPVMIEAAAGKRDALTIYGTDYPTPDGTCVRDYVHVMDLVDAHIKGLEWLLEGKGSRVFNLGTGTGFSVKEVIAECKAATGCEVPHSFGPRRVGDAAALVSGSRRVAEELGWSPERSTLQHMIADDRCGSRLVLG